jgi:hypothetical protein
MNQPNDSQRLDWLLSRLNGLMLDMLAAQSCVTPAMFPVDRTSLDRAIAGARGTVEPLRPGDIVGQPMGERHEGNWAVRNDKRSN